MEKVLIGYGGFSKEIMADIGLQLKCFVDDEYVMDDKTKKISEFDSKKYQALIAVGDPNIRKKLVNALPPDTVFWNHISKHAILLDDNINIGYGSIICAGVIISTNVYIGNHVQLNLQTTVGHDSILKDFITTAPSVNISGNVKINEIVYLGTNVVVKEKINICKNVTIGLNAGVVKDINEPGTYIGTPAIKLY